MADNTPAIEVQRKALGYHAVIEAIALTGTLQRELTREDDLNYDSDIRTVGPSLLRRIDELQHVVLDLLDANELSADDMRRIIHGARAGGGGRSPALDRQ